ncbi:MAG TPA: sugar ABC transporter permease [Halanaerobiales bacterium]|nr:sugar ABC transporter permease [Halanaerobiales bacterium]
MGQYKFKNNKLAYFLVLPQFFIVTIFILYPTYKSLEMSVFRSSIFGGNKTFVGLQNFGDLFSSPDYLKTLLVSLIFAAGVTIIGLALSLFISVLVNNAMKGLTVYRTLFIWPYALSPAVAGAIWMFIMHPSYGIMNSILPFKLDWILNGQHALILIIIAATWRMLGYNIAFYIAGLQSVPVSLREAAALDGASGFQKFFKITFPLLTPTTFFLLTMNLVYSFFRTFGLIHTVTKGGPSGMTEIMVYKTYKDGFINLVPGLSAAQSVILLAIVIGIISIQFRFLEGKVHYA